MDDLPRLIVTPVRRGEHFATDSAIHAATYLSGTALTRTDGSVVDFPHHTYIIHNEIVLPGQYDGNPDMWARNRQDLWTAADNSEKWVKSATLAREFLGWFPKELPTESLPDIGRQFAKFLADRYQAAVDFAVDHKKGKAHFHALMTARRVTSEGLGRVAFSPESHGRPLENGKWQSDEADWREIRGEWGNILNAALSEKVRSASVATWRTARQEAGARSAPIAEHDGPKSGGRDHPEI